VEVKIHTIMAKVRHTRFMVRTPGVAPRARFNISTAVIRQRFRVENMGLVDCYIAMEL